MTASISSTMPVGVTGIAMQPAVDSSSIIEPTGFSSSIAPASTHELIGKLTDEQVKFRDELEQQAKLLKKLEEKTNENEYDLDLEVVRKEPENNIGAPTKTSCHTATGCTVITACC